MYPTQKDHITHQIKEMLTKNWKPSLSRGKELSGNGETDRPRQMQRKRDRDREKQRDMKRETKTERAIETGL